MRAKQISAQGRIKVKRNGYLANIHTICVCAHVRNEIQTCYKQAFQMNKRNWDFSNKCENKSHLFISSASAACVWYGSVSV